MPWITAKDLKVFDLQDSQERLTDAGAERASVAPENTVLMLVRGMGLFKGIPIGVTSRPMAFNQDIKALHPKEDITARFLGYALQGQRHYLMGNVDQAGHGTGRLPTSVVEELPLPVPKKLDEQRRIVCLLDAADRQIQLAEKIAHEAAGKVLAMTSSLVFQGLRSTAPFDIMKSKRLAKRGWKRTTIAQIASEVRRVNREGMALPVLSSTKQKGIVFSDDYFGKQVYSANTSTYKRVRRGEFVYATNHIEEGSIGMQDICDEGLVSPMYTVFELDEPLVDPYFLIALLKTETYRQIFSANTSASVDRRGSLRWKDFSRLPVHLPDMDLQREVAAQIAASKRYLEICNSRLNGMREQKRGLMQQLLTGQHRLTRDLPGMEPGDV